MERAHTIDYRVQFEEIKNELDVQSVSRYLFLTRKCDFTYCKQIKLKKIMGDKIKKETLENICYLIILDVFTCLVV